MMKWFLDLSTRGKLFLGFGTMVALLAIVIATAYSGFSSIRASQKALYERDFANALDLQTLRAAQNGGRAAILSMMAVTQQSDRDFWHQDVKVRSKLIEETLQRLQARGRGDPNFLARMREYQAVRDTFVHTQDVELIPLIFK